VGADRERLGRNGNWQTAGGSSARDATRTLVRAEVVKAAASGDERLAAEGGRVVITPGNSHGIRSAEGNPQRAIPGGAAV